MKKGLILILILVVIVLVAFTATMVAIMANNETVRLVSSVIAIASMFPMGFMAFPIVKHFWPEKYKKAKGEEIVN